MTFLYTIDYLYFDNSIKTEYGALNANSFTEAMTTIENYYEDDLISVKFLTAFDSPTLIIPEKSFSAIQEAQN